METSSSRDEGNGGEERVEGMGRERRVGELGLGEQI
jgi:hypothetical protein